MESAAGQKRHIVIVGGGIIGCTTAYYITRHPSFNPALHKVTLLEASAIAAGSSGKAGGLLALWAYPSCLVPLSYRLHAELAKEHGGAQRWGYRSVGCGTISAVVKDADLKRAAAAQPKHGMAKDEGSVETTASSVLNGVKDMLGVGSNGSEAKPSAQGENPLPVQSSKPEASSEKTWEKLPKQDAAATAQLKDSPLPTDLDWIDGSLVRSYEKMGQGRGGKTDTAQVHPFHFTTAMGELAKEAGVDIRLQAKVTKINQSKTALESVEYEDRTTGQTVVLDDVNDVVVTAGPWTGKLLPGSHIDGLRAHSVVMDAEISPYAVFTDIQLPTNWVPEHRKAQGQKRKHKGNVDPEIYARPFGEVYACGEPDTTIPLPETADQVQTDETTCDDLVSYVSTISPVLAAAPVKTKQACYLPRHMRSGKEGNPLVGRTGVDGLWIASGHTCWGIQNGPATGYLMAEMLLDGKAKSANIDILDPRKFQM